jgi:hypothetical protein
LYFSRLDAETANKAYTYRASGFKLNPQGLPAVGPGDISWDPVNETAVLGLAYGVLQQIGEEWYARVQNDTGVEVPNGTVVCFAGVGEDKTLSIAPYVADGSIPSLYVLGVMTHDLPDTGNKGYATVWGHVRDLDTTGADVGETWAEGDVLYASPTYAGKFTNTKPTAPNNCTPVAAVLSVDETAGEIFVRPTIEQQKYYGTFAKTTSQSPAAVDTPYTLTFDSISISNGVAIGAPTSRLVVPQSGLYKIDVSLQLSSSSSSAKTVWAWLRKNGADVANTARLVTVDTNGGYIPLAINEPLPLAAYDYVEVAFAANDTSVSVAPVASTAFAPGAPAATVSVTQVQL